MVALIMQINQRKSNLTYVLKLFVLKTITSIVYKWLFLLVIWNIISWKRRETLTLNNLTKVDMFETNQPIR